MCYGSAITCKGCTLSTIYLLPGVHRCPTLNTLAHKTTGPNTTSNTCWRCRATPGSSAEPLSEVSTMLSWYDKTRTLFGFDDELLEARNIASELDSGIGSVVDQAAKAELEQLKKAADERVRELEAVKKHHGAWAHGDNSSQCIVVVPPGVGDRVPLTFQEWNARFVEERFGSKWEELNLDCERYEEYLEKNGFEYECDQFHVKVANESAIGRSIFQFNEVTEGKLDFRAWRRKERLGAIKHDQQGLAPRSTAEIFESTLDLYCIYLADTLDEVRLDEALELYMWRGVCVKLRRYTLYGLENLSLTDAEAQIDATPAPKMADKDEFPMTFAEWCASPLAEADLEINRNTDSALRADLSGYQHYLFRFSEFSSSHEEHSYVLHRLQSAYRDDFTSRKSDFVAHRTNSQPLSLKEFSQNLDDQGYRRIRSSLGWTGDAYKLYLGQVTDETEVNGFAMSRNWCARGDRRELEGLPRWDPATAKLKRIMEWLARYISSPEHAPVRLGIQEQFSGPLLILSSCMDQSREPTAEQWREIRSIVRATEVTVEQFLAPNGIRHSLFGGFVNEPPRLVQYGDHEDTGNDDSDSEDDWSVDHDDYVPHRYSHHGRVNPFDLIGDDHPDSDNEAEGDDFDRLFDEDHQTVNAPIIPSQDLDDGNSSENNREVEEPLNLFELREILLELADDAENTDEEE